jgi:hypothetical protein
MGLFANLFSVKARGTPAEKKEIFILMGTAKFELEIAGEENFQAALKAICGPRHAQGENRTEMALLVLDDKNRRDHNAVRVEIRGRQVGYLSPNAATLYREHLMAKSMPGAVGQCLAVIKGGWISSDGRTGLYEVRLDFPVLCKRG